MEDVPVGMNHLPTLSSPSACILSTTLQTSDTIRMMCFPTRKTNILRHRRTTADPDYSVVGFDVALYGAIGSESFGLFNVGKRLQRRSRKCAARPERCRGGTIWSIHGFSVLEVLCGKDKCKDMLTGVSGDELWLCWL
jgi:hypothetical protein